MFPFCGVTLGEIAVITDMIRWSSLQQHARSIILLRQAQVPAGDGGAGAGARGRVWRRRLPAHLIRRLHGDAADGG